MFVFVRDDGLSIGVSQVVSVADHEVCGLCADVVDEVRIMFEAFMWYWVRAVVV